jgi:hypothetical protein
VANELFTEAIESATLAGMSLDEIDTEIIDPAGLSPRQKGALLLFAYSLRRRGEQRRYARECLAIAGMSLPVASSQHRSRPLSVVYQREQHSGQDRRRGPDRRQRQDPVAVERRSGLDRRRDEGRLRLIAQGT